MHPEIIMLLEFSYYYFTTRILTIFDKALQNELNLKLEQPSLYLVPELFRQVEK